MQAVPLMCIPKKDEHLRTVIDARQRNENMVKDVTPLPDQEKVRFEARKPQQREIDEIHKQVH